MAGRVKAVYLEVAELHAAGIDQGFLSSLGEEFLALLYEAIDSSKDAVLLVEYSRGRVVGFVSGATTLTPIYKALLKKPLRLIAALWPVFLSPVKLWRIVEIIVHTLRPSNGALNPALTQLPEFELISIAVLSNARRTGVALKLYERLKQAASAHGFANFKITVGDQLDGAHNFYTRMGAVPVAETIVHGNSTSIIYVQEI